MFSDDRRALQALDETLGRLTTFQSGGVIWHRQGEQEQQELLQQRESYTKEAPEYIRPYANTNAAHLPRLLSKKNKVVTRSTNFAAITLKTNRVRSSEREVDLDAIDFEERCAAPGYFERTLRNKDTHLRASDKRQTEKPPFLRSTSPVSGPAGVRKRKQEAAKLKQLAAPTHHQQQQQQQQQEKQEMEGLLQHFDLSSVAGIQVFLREYTSSSSTDSSIPKSFAYLQDQVVLANNGEEDEEAKNEGRRRVSINAAALHRGITHFYESYTGYSLPAASLPFTLIESLYSAMKIDTASSQPHIYYGQYWLFCAQEETVKEYIALEEAIRERLADCLEQQGEAFTDFLFTQLFPPSSSIPSRCRVCRKELKKATCFLHNWRKEDELEEAPRKTEHEKAQSRDVVSHFVFWDALSKLDLGYFSASQMSAYYSRFDLNGEQRYFSSQAFLHVMSQGLHWQRAKQIVRARALAEALHEANVLRRQQRRANDVHPNLNDQEQVLDMAASLGIKPISEPHFLWLAKFATQTSSLPKFWTFALDTTTGKRVYRHTVTNTLHSEHPHYTKLLALKERLDKSEQGAKRRLEVKKQGQNMLNCLQLLQRKEEEESRCRLLISAQQIDLDEAQQETVFNRPEIEEQEHEHEHEQQQEEQVPISMVEQCSTESTKKNEEEGEEEKSGEAASSITDSRDHKEAILVISSNEEDAMQFIVDSAAISDSLILEGSSMLLFGEDSLAGLRVVGGDDNGNDNSDERQEEYEGGLDVGDQDLDGEECDDDDDLAAFSLEERLVNAAYQRALREEAEEEEKLLVCRSREQQAAHVAEASDDDEGNNDEDDEFDRPLSFVTLVSSEGSTN